MSLQCESTQRWRRENEEDGEGGLWVGRHGEEGRVWRGWGGGRERSMSLESFEGCVFLSPSLVPRRPAFFFFFFVARI